jgi:hypothetical protein
MKNMLRQFLVAGILTLLLGGLLYAGHDPRYNIKGGASAAAAA